MPTEFGKRLKKAREHAGLTQDQLAEKVGMAQSTLASAESSGYGSRKTPQLAAACGVDANWLATGEGEMMERTPPPISRPPSPHGNVVAVPTGDMVPLISWVQAGDWSPTANPYVTGNAEEWLPCPTRHGERTIALRVRGESMSNPGFRPSYEDGDVIYVDPDREAQPGDRVVVRLDDQDEATFKQLVFEDGRKLLKAINPDWKPRYLEINGNATTVGVVIGKWVPD